MNLIINVPDDMYVRIMHDEYTDKDQMSVMQSIISKGVPINKIEEEVKQIFNESEEWRGEVDEVLLEVLEIINKYVEEIN